MTVVHELIITSYDLNAKTDNSKLYKVLNWQIAHDKTCNFISVWS